MKIMVVGEDGTLEAEYDHPNVLPDAVIAIDGFKGTISGMPVIRQIADPDGGQPTHEVESVDGQTESLDNLLQE